ncbi:MAG TPA: hypothetical protein VFQ73_13635 [Flavisolibacter sp.]|nr:hypothetical protein [Flavisolibacter sp.]
MQHLIRIFLVITFLSIQKTNAQQYNQLEELKDHSVRIYYSAGHEQRAQAIVKRVDRAMEYYQELLDFKPEVTLLVLTETDWGKYTSFPVYGMPHYNDDKTLIVAAEDNAFWKSFIPPLDQLPKDLKNRIEDVYKDSKGNLSMEAFFDLLALHELGHAFHFQAGLNMQRKWMGELFVNILLHSFIAEKEPASLQALTLFPRMVVAGGTKEFTYTSLKDVHERYNEIGKEHPKNYGWYQCRWHTTAGIIYDAAGEEAGKQLWNAFKNQKETLTDEAIPHFLDQSGAKEVADMIRNWDKETIH